MPTVPCANKVTCPCTDSPISNYSTEDADARRYFSRRWFSSKPKLDGNDNNSGEHFLASGCLSICYSEVSQQAADDCALAQATLCVIDDQTDDDGNPVQAYYNVEKVCPSVCVDGTVFYGRVAAGTYVASSQAQADAMAYSRACYLAYRQRMCITVETRHGCTGSSFTCLLTAAGASSPTYWISSALPAGLTLQYYPAAGLGPTQAAITGTPTVNGTYTIVVTAFTGSGTYSVRSFQLRFLEITDTDPLDDGTVGEAYIHQFTAAGGSGDYTWSVVDGELPAGLTLDPTGLLYGDPTEEDTDFFTIQVCDNNF